jgi:hypothetical protein
MVQENILPTRLIDSPEKREKRIVDDVQLCCAVILVFYRKYGQTWLSVDDVFSHVDSYHIATKEKVSALLETLNDEYIISKRIITDNSKTNHVQYTWSIRSSENGLIHFAGK